VGICFVPLTGTDDLIEAFSCACVGEQTLEMKMTTVKVLAIAALLVGGTSKITPAGAAKPQMKQ
jgi:hypothetical protein